MFPRCSPGGRRASNFAPNPALGKEARSRTRTDDPFLTMEVLYRLSYPGGLAPL
jgi:hypothetical protein